MELLLVAAYALAGQAIAVVGVYLVLAYLGEVPGPRSLMRSKYSIFDGRPLYAHTTGDFSETPQHAGSSPSAHAATANDVEASAPVFVTPPQDDPQHQSSLTQADTRATSNVGGHLWNPQLLDMLNMVSPELRLRSGHISGSDITRTDHSDIDRLSRTVDALIGKLQQDLTTSVNRPPLYSTKSGTFRFYTLLGAHPALRRQPLNLQTEHVESNVRHFIRNPTDSFIVAGSAQTPKHQDIHEILRAMRKKRPAQTDEETDIHSWLQKQLNPEGAPSPTQDDNKPMRYH